MTTEEIDNILQEASAAGYQPNKGDIVFALLRESIGNEAAAYLAFRSIPKNLPKYVNGSKVKFIRRKLDTNIVRLDVVKPTVEQGGVNLSSYTKEENQRRMLAEIENINVKERRGEYDTEKAALTRIKIYSELNKNFEMDKSEDERRIIEVPRKHDIVCPHTHRECTYMPTKDACCKYYNLREK